MITPSLFKRGLTKEEMDSAILVSNPVGQRGQMNLHSENNTTKKDPFWIVQDGNFVYSETELQERINNVESMVDVFNTWGRFSHNANDQPGIPSELTAWRLNDKQEIECTLNSKSVIGFYSPNKVEQYIFETQIISKDRDNDQLGIVLAFHVDEQGIEYTLAAFRNNDSDATWCVRYNYGMIGSYIVAQKSAVIPQGDNWDTYPNGTTIRAERNADIIKCWSTINNSTTLLDSSEITIDLNSDPRLHKFKGPQQYGYVCLSQGTATWRNPKFQELGGNAIENYIFDMRNQDIWIKDAVGTYQKSSMKFEDIIPTGRLFRDKITGILSMVKTNNTYVTLSVPTRFVLNGSVLTITEGL